MRILDVKFEKLKLEKSIQNFSPKYIKLRGIFETKANILLYRDAEDAVHARDGYDYDGYRLRVEFPRGGGPSNNFRGGRGAGDSGRGGRGDMNNSRGRGPPARRSQYRVLVTGLPPSGSWQDLKDHMREAGDVCFADVYKDGTGVVEFLRYEDMKYAVKKLDDSRFRSHEVSTFVLLHLDIRISQFI